jgi:predicted esterase
MAAKPMYLRAPLYDFHEGTTLDSPILFPLPGRRSDVRSMVRFCRQVFPGAPMLIPNLERFSERNRLSRTATAGQFVDRLAALISKAVKTYGLSLIPIIAMGHAEGADLTVQLALKHGSLLGASILFQPKVCATPNPRQTLEGLHVLLVRTASEEAVGSVGRQVHDVLEKAGARVISERASSHRAPGSREAAIARVFISALFGENWPRQRTNGQSHGRPNA